MIKLIILVQPTLSLFYMTLSYYLFVSKGLNNFHLPLHSLMLTFGLFNFLYMAISVLE